MTIRRIKVIEYIIVVVHLLVLSGTSGEIGSMSSLEVILVHLLDLDTSLLPIIVTDGPGQVGKHLVARGTVI